MNSTKFAPTWTTAADGGPPSVSARSRKGTTVTPSGAVRGVRIIHTHGTVPPSTPTSATLNRNAVLRGIP